MMQVGSDSKIPESRCPHCGEELDAATSVGESATPSPGDFTVCIKCGEVLRFGDGLLLVTCSVAELDTLDEEHRRYLDVTQIAIKAMRGGASLKPSRYQS